MTFSVAKITLRGFVALFSIAALDLWHRNCLYLCQLRRKLHGAVRFLHLFKFGLVVWRNYPPGQQAIARFPAVFYMHLFEVLRRPEWGAGAAQKTRYVISGARIALRCIYRKTTHAFSIVFHNQFLAVHYICCCIIGRPQSRM